MVLSDRVCVMNQGAIVQQGVPRDLYDRPSDLFVAEFVGQANVLTILEAGAATIRIGVGVVLQVPAANRRDDERSSPRALSRNRCRGRLSRTRSICA